MRSSSQQTRGRGGGRRGLSGSGGSWPWKLGRGEGWEWEKVRDRIGPWAIGLHRFVCDSRSIENSGNSEKSVPECLTRITET